MHTMNMILLFLLALSGFAINRATAAETASQPAVDRTVNPRLNIVFFLVDDLGWGDNSLNGGGCYETPNLERLARQGVTFSDAYSAAALCSPTRASILTGRYPARLHLTHVLGPADATDRKLDPPDWTKYMGLDELTIAEALRAAGYATGSFGKWHLEGARNFKPALQGFDVTTFDRHVTQHFYPYYSIAPFPAGEEGEYLTDRLTKDALGFIQSNQDKPFFVYLSHYAVHVSANGKLEARSDYIKNYEQDTGCTGMNTAYAAAIQSMDQSLGAVLDKLEELNIADQTVVIFASDNGGWEGVTSNAPLRAGKASAYEGGIRVPLVIKWPLEGMQGCVVSEPVTSTDFYPTVLEMAGLQMIPEQHLDGVSLVPLLKSNRHLEREALYWHFPHYHASFVPWGAVRKGDWKLIEYFEKEGPDRYELYNLRNDLGEKTNLAQKEPAIRLNLQQMLEAWRRSVGAQMPTANPEFGR